MMIRQIINQMLRLVGEREFRACKQGPRINITLPGHPRVVRGLLPDEAAPLLRRHNVDFSPAELREGGTDLTVRMRRFAAEETIFSSIFLGPRIKVDGLFEIEEGCTLGEGVHALSSSLTGASHVEGDVLLVNSILHDAQVYGMVGERDPRQRKITSLVSVEMINSVIDGAVTCDSVAMRDSYLEGAADARATVGNYLNWSPTAQAQPEGALRPAVAAVLKGLNDERFQTADDLFRVAGITDPVLQRRVRFLFEIAKKETGSSWIAAARRSGMRLV